MRVLVAPDSFGDTLTAVQAAEAIADGWRRRQPDADVVPAPMADGGPGFVDVLHASLGGRLLALTVPDQGGDDVPAAVLLVESDAGTTAYVESAQACGLHLRERRDPLLGSTAGVGRLVRAAVEAGAARVVVGVGGTGTNDGGAGLLAELGAVTPAGTDLRGGPSGLDGLAVETPIDLTAAREVVAGVDLVLATDVDSPLLGIRGATATYGPQKGVSDEQVPLVDRWLEGYAAAVDQRLVLKPGAGSGGGLGFALLALGGRREPGIRLVAQTLDLVALARSSDLVVTGEGSFDFQSRSGKVPYGVAEVAAEATRPCIALAGQVLVGSREMRAMGVESAYAMVDLVGPEASFAEPAESLARLAERVARTWAL